MTAVWVGIELAAVAPTIALHKSIPQDSNSAPAMQTDHLAVFAGKIDAEIYPVVTAHPFDALVEVTDAEGVAALCPVLEGLARRDTMLNLTSRTANGLTNAERFCGLMSHQSEIAESQ